MTKAALIAAALLSLSLSGACRAGDAVMTQNSTGDAAQEDIGEIGFGLWRVEGAPGRCLISLSKTSAGPGARMALSEGCHGQRLESARRWRVVSGVIEIVDERGRVLARVRHQGPDVLTGEGVRLTRAPEA
ncbi:MAG: AprI/Inh family metalloprotease inhibitor [Caulobacterales bacterium]|nr:AprI/Inh family metalloprotease inhibitor [Caulobacterales bacterium]